MAVPGAAAANAAHIAVGTASVDAAPGTAFPSELVYTILSYSKDTRSTITISNTSTCTTVLKFACYMWEGYTTAHVRMLYVGRPHNGADCTDMHMHTASSVKQESCIVVCAAQQTRSA